LSTWKLNNPKAMSKPPVIAKTASAVPEVGPAIVVAGMSSVALDGVMSRMVSMLISALASV
jgi:hypothetical protein